MGLSTNFSQKIREIDALGKAIFTDIGETVKVGIMEEFTVLVNETAQWTGTTAASWNVSLGGVGDGGGVRVRPERTRSQALQKGHAEAVNIALSANASALDGLTTMGLPGQKGNKYRAIMVENYSPQAERVEFGVLRDVNSPNGALARFEARVINRVFETVRDRQL